MMGYRFFEECEEDTEYIEMRPQPRQSLREDY